MSDTHDTSVTLTAIVYGREVEVEDVEVTVTYDYEPGERAIRYGDNACPGSDPYVTIESVTVTATGEDVTSEVDEDALADEIAESIACSEEAAREEWAERRADARRDR